MSRLLWYAIFASGALAAQVSANLGDRDWVDAAGWFIWFLIVVTFAITLEERELR